MIVREKVKESYKALVTENKAANELIETEV